MQVVYTWRKLCSRQPNVVACTRTALEQTLRIYTPQPSSAASYTENRFSLHAGHCTPCNHRSYANLCRMSLLDSSSASVANLLCSSIYSRRSVHTNTCYCCCCSSLLLGPEQRVSGEVDVLVHESGDKKVRVVVALLRVS